MVLLVSYNGNSFQVNEINYNPLVLDFKHRKDIKPAIYFLQTYRNLFGNDMTESTGQVWSSKKSSVR
jgi:hypothetical protein